jgi:hypothetical protein
VPVVFPLRIEGVFHVKSCVFVVIDFVLLHIPYVVYNRYFNPSIPEARQFYARYSFAKLPHLPAGFIVFSGYAMRPRLI